MANAAAVRDRIIAEIRVGVVHFDLSAVRFFGVAGMDTLLDGHAVLHRQGKTLRFDLPAGRGTRDAHMWVDRTQRPDCDDRDRSRSGAAARRAAQ